VSQVALLKIAQQDTARDQPAFALDAEMVAGSKKSTQKITSCTFFCINNQDASICNSQIHDRPETAKVFKTNGEFRSWFT